MTPNDSVLLEKAYLSISQKMPSVPTDNKRVPNVEPNEIVHSGSVHEPAPGTDMDMVAPEPTDLSDISPEGPVGPAMVADEPISSELSSEDPRMDIEDENEEDSMAIENLNSIRESIMKIAKFCASGGHIEPWQQQKLAICMDNLAQVARSVKCD